MSPIAKYLKTIKLRRMIFHGSSAICLILQIMSLLLVDEKNGNLLGNIANVSRFKKLFRKDITEILPLIFYGDTVDI